MAPSQLKRLKTSLREQGVVRTQQSKKQKKQKKQAGRNGHSKDGRVLREAALQGIRELFNPFEVKVATRKSKYEFANGPGGKNNGVVGRPGVTKGLGEDTVCFLTCERYFGGLRIYLETKDAFGRDAAT